MIKERYGEPYLPEKPPIYRTKAKGRRRRTRPFARPPAAPPEDLRDILSREQHRLYDLIWKRFVASQMGGAVRQHDGGHWRLGTGDWTGKVSPIPNHQSLIPDPYTFRATGSVLKFPAFWLFIMSAWRGRGR